MLEEVRLRDLARRHLVRNFQNLVSFCKKHGVAIPTEARKDVEMYRQSGYFEKLFLQEKNAVHHKFQQVKERKKKTKKRRLKTVEQAQPKKPKNVSTAARLPPHSPRAHTHHRPPATLPYRRSSPPACPPAPSAPLSAPHAVRCLSSRRAPSPARRSAPATSAGKKMITVGGKRYNTRLRKKILNASSQHATPAPSPPSPRDQQPAEMDLSQHLTLSDGEEAMVAFFIRQLQSGKYLFRPQAKTNPRSKRYTSQQYHTINMHDCLFNAKDLKDFAKYGQFCSSDMVKVSAMCTYDALIQSSFEGKINKLLVVKEEEVQLLAVSADECGMASNVWKHVNKKGNVLALVLGRSRGVHFVGVFIRKIRDRIFDVYSRNSSPKFGGNANAYCKDAQSMVIRCADVSWGAQEGENASGIEFLVNVPPVWQQRQRPGSNACGHHQAANCVLAAAGLLDTHIVNDKSLALMRRHTLWQILKKDNTLALPHHRSQVCNGKPVDLFAKDYVVRHIDSGSKLADCRPAYPYIASSKPRAIRWRCARCSRSRRSRRSRSVADSCRPEHWPPTNTKPSNRLGGPRRLLTTPRPRSR